MTPEQEIKALKERIKKLEDFVTQKKRQQISFPLDVASKKIIQDV